MKNQKSEQCKFARKIAKFLKNNDQGTGNERAMDIQKNPDCLKENAKIDVLM